MNLEQNLLQYDGIETGCDAWFNDENNSWWKRVEQIWLVRLVAEVAG